MSNIVKPNLNIDFRERSSLNSPIIQEFNDFFNISFRQLPVGDYIIEDKIIIERKTIPDFMQSIKDGRIFKQAYRMANFPGPSLLLIEGNKNEMRNYNIKRNAVLGVFVHISVLMGIPVLRSENYRESFSMIKSLGDQLYNMPSYSKIYPKNPPVRVSQPADRHKIQLVQSIPGLGSNKACNLLRKFGSVKNIAKATPEKLMRVEGIGKKLSQNIVSLLQGEFGT
jgi:DNA excision repair protein ERCC-4